MSNPKINGRRTRLFTTVRSIKSANIAMKKLSESGRDSVRVKDEWRYLVYATKPYPVILEKTKIVYEGML